MQELKSSVQKTFTILEYFTVEKPCWGVTELAASIGSNKSTIYRFLSDLCHMGVLYKNRETEKYSLGIKLFELGNRVQLKSALVDKTHPILVEVAKSIKETVHIGILKNNQVFYIDKVESPHGLKVSSTIGSFGPAYATSLGKVLLSYLSSDQLDPIVNEIFSIKPKKYTDNTITESISLKRELIQIKQQGYAIDKEESELGLICVAIPIFNLNNEIIASLSASGPASRFEEENVTSYVITLKKGADKIKNSIGFYKP